MRRVRQMVLQIRPIAITENSLIKTAIELAMQRKLENIVLLGDLHQPCLQISDIYGIFDQKNRMISSFSVFKAFSNPSIALPFTSSKKIIDAIFSFLKKSNYSVLWIVVVGNEWLSHYAKKYFKIDSISDELMMVLPQEVFKKKKQSIIPIPLTQRNYILIKAKKDDSNVIERFYNTVGVQLWHPIQLESGFYYYIANDQEDVVACGGTHFETNFSAQLGNIYVHPDFRRQGLGEQLVLAVTREILSRKKLATLFVAKNNHAAISLYKKLGFFVYAPVKILSVRL